MQVDGAIGSAYGVSPRATSLRAVLSAQVLVSSAERRTVNSLKILGVT